MLNTKNNLCCLFLKFLQDFWKWKQIFVFKTSYKYLKNKRQNFVLKNLAKVSKTMGLILTDIWDLYFCETKVCKGSTWSAQITHMGHWAIDSCGHNKLLYTVLGWPIVPLTAALRCKFMCVPYGFTTWGLMLEFYLDLCQFAQVIVGANFHIKLIMAFDRDHLKTN